MTMMPIRTAFIPEAIAPDERTRVAAMPNAERQQRFADMLIRHDGFDKILDFLDLAHMPIPGGMPNVGRITAVYGPYRSGKTTALKYYRSRFPDVVEGTTVKRKILYFHCHGNMTVNDLLKGILGAVTGLVAPNKSGDLLIPRVIEQIAIRGVEMLILDDLYTLVPPNRRDNQKRINSFLIKLLESNVCHVTVAGPPELDAVLRVDAQVEGRGGLLNPKIPRYDWHDPESRNRYRILLDKIDERLPMKSKSGLGATNIAAHFYDMFGDSVGFALDLVFYAMAFAMRGNAHHITVDHLAMAAALQRDPNDPFTHFVDEIPMDLVGRRKGRDGEAGRRMGETAPAPFEDR